MKYKYIIAALLGSALLAVSAAVPASAAPAHRHAGRAVEIRIAGTHRCVTADRYRAGALVRAERCRDLRRQRWIIGRGAVRLAGTRLGLLWSPHRGAVVLSRRLRADDWRLRHHHLADVALSRRFHAPEALTLPGIRRPAAGAVLAVREFVPFSSTPGHLVDPGWQGIRIIRRRFR